MTQYRIPDEPLPSRWQHLAVRPIWPLLSLMLAGSWLSWPWLVINGKAMGSPTIRKELLLCLAGLLVGAAYAYAVVRLVADGVVESEFLIELLVFALSMWRLAIAYWVMVLQSRTFDIYEHFGGRVRSGLWVLLGGMLLRGSVLGPLGSFWALVLGGGLRWP